MNIHIIILFIIAFLEFILGIFILSRGPRSEIKISYSLFVFSVALWCLTVGFVYHIKDPNVILYFSKLPFLAAAFIASNFLYFSWVFPFKKVILTLVHKLLIILPGLVVLIILYCTDWFIKETIITSWGRDLVIGPFYHIFSLYFISFWIWGLVNLVKKFMISDGIHRWQLRYLLWGIFISSAVGITTNLILPWIGYRRLGLFGPESSIVWLGFTSYIVLKR